MANERQFRLTLIGEEGTRPLELDEMSRALMQELRSVGGLTLAPVAGESPPEGAKGDAFTIAQFAMTVGTSVVAESMVVAVKGWLGRRPKGIVIDIQHGERTLKVTGSTPSDPASVSKMVQQFLTPSS